MRLVPLKFTAPLRPFPSSLPQQKRQGSLLDGERVLWREVRSSLVGICGNLPLVFRTSGLPRGRLWTGLLRPAPGPKKPSSMELFPVARNGPMQSETSPMGAMISGCSANKSLSPPKAVPNPEPESFRASGCRRPVDVCRGPGIRGQTWNRGCRASSKFQGREPSCRRATGLHSSQYAAIAAFLYLPGSLGDAGVVVTAFQSEFHDPRIKEDFGSRLRRSTHTRDSTLVA